MKEYYYLLRFVRFIDYMAVERFSDTVFKVFTDLMNTICKPNSAIFQIDINFSDDGFISFTPSLDTLISTLSSNLNLSIFTISNLPRIFELQEIRDVFVYNNIYPYAYFSNIPNLSDLFCLHHTLKMQWKEYLILFQCHTRTLKFAAMIFSSTINYISLVNRGMFVTIYVLKMENHIANFDA